MTEDKGNASKKRPKFRSYRPNDASLQSLAVPVMAPNALLASTLSQRTDSVPSRPALQSMPQPPESTQTNINTPETPETTVLNTIEDDIQGKAQETIQTLRDQESRHPVLVDISELAPKTLDWDLKQASQKRLDQVERKTQAAIATLLRMI